MDHLGQLTALCVFVFIIVLAMDLCLWGCSFVGWLFGGGLRFSTRQLLIATTVIAVVLGGMMVLIRQLP